MSKVAFYAIFLFIELHTFYLFFFFQNKFFSCLAVLILIPLIYNPTNRPLLSAFRRFFVKSARFIKIILKNLNNFSRTSRRLIAYFYNCRSFRFAQHYPVRLFWIFDHSLRSTVVNVHMCLCSFEIFGRKTSTITSCMCVCLCRPHSDATGVNENEKGSTKSCAGKLLRSVAVGCYTRCSTIMCSSACALQLCPVVCAHCSAVLAHQYSFGYACSSAYSETGGLCVCCDHHYTRLEIVAL